jgi:hypothetical protein
MGMGTTPQIANEMSGVIAIPIEPNWWEFRFKGKQPERRGYHSSFIYNEILHVFGGKDIGSGFLNNIWCLDL